MIESSRNTGLGAATMKLGEQISDSRKAGASLRVLGRESRFRLRS